VQVAPVVNPVTVTDSGVASEIDPEAGDGVPLLQLMFTGTLAPLFGTKSLLTTNVALFSVLVIVQLAAPPLEMATPAQAAWLAV
jgi:hypothetical protein